MEDTSHKRRRNVATTTPPEDHDSVVSKKARITSSPSSPSPFAGREKVLKSNILYFVFRLFNYRDRARLASVCKHWRHLSDLPYFWRSLDLRAHSLDSDSITALSSRCSQLQTLKFRGGAFARSIPQLQARNLQSLAGDCCSQLSDATLSMLVARHENLESLQLGSDCERLTSESLKVVALCCPKLRRLSVSGMREIDGDSIRQLSQHCPSLHEIGFLESSNIDERAFAGCSSLRFLSVAGCRCVTWISAAVCWSKLPNLIGLDVSRTEITPSALTHLLAAPKLKALVALQCPLLEDDDTFKPSKSSKPVLLTRFTDLNRGLDSLLEHGELVDWAEWMLSHALLKMAESNSPSLASFWLKQGTSMMLRLVGSGKEDVQERAATALATFVVVDDENATVDSARAESVMNGGGIALLLELAKSSREGVQCEAAKVFVGLIMLCLIGGVSMKVEITIVGFCRRLRIYR